ncbi:BLUF domain-containing protein [Rhodopirellula sp. P2]|uniref:BLUF domain-containing protein n=1 Tax=Rhodopirellula sp. P2 TaxID=2127060 RepID=UPI0023677713|nr:BLUF domain-containing protein [Rhodopirellula sp. P2]WDQ16096.1 BLUF domain-containing protein [Rhodopirellula sp. P2]
MLTELVYCSVATRDMSAEDLKGLLDQSRQKNARLSVTGILLYSDQSREFIQLLEGEQDAIEQLMEVITVDDRHTSVDVMYQGNIKTRSFDGWSMAFRKLDDVDPKLLEGSPTFNANSLPPALLNGRNSRARSIVMSLSEKM